MCKTLKVNEGGDGKSYHTASLFCMAGSRSKVHDMSEWTRQGVLFCQVPEGWQCGQAEGRVKIFRKKVRKVTLETWAAKII